MEKEGWCCFKPEMCSFLKAERERLRVSAERLREEFSSFKSGTGREREVQLRKTASQSCEAEVMDSAQRTVTVFS